MSDLKTALEAVFQPLPKCPRSFRHSSIVELYAEYEAQLEDRRFPDQRGNEIHFFAENFPHLVKLEFFNKKTRTWVEAKAEPTIRYLKSKTFDESLHRICDTSRARTLFWVPEVIAHCDAIHDHKKKAQMEIYVRRYHRDKSAAPIKLVLVEKRRTGLWVIKTSFWTTDSYLQGCATMPAKHCRTK